MKLASLIATRSAALAFALTTFTAIAGAAQVRVHVPVAAEWGGALLPAGDYTFDYDGTAVARMSGNGKDVAIFVTSVSQCPAHAASSVKLTDQNGTPAVTELTAGAQGLTYKFASAEPRHHS